MKNVVIVPARSGSKRVKNKNIKKLNNIPLFVWSLQTASKHFLNEEIWFTTDSEEYAKIANDYGFNNVIMRNEDMSNDTFRNIDLLSYFACNNYFDNVNLFWLFQPTSPFRSNKFIERCKNSSISIGKNGTLASISPFIKKREDWVLVENNKKELQFLDTNNKNVTFLDASIYIFDKDYLLSKNKKMVNEKTILVEGDYYSSIDINTMHDFKIAKLLADDFLLNNN
jgi:CMP-N-acetylneuraminic acid synthetase